jgi:hypothetical protein
MLLVISLQLLLPYNITQALSSIQTRSLGAVRVALITPVTFRGFWGVVYKDSGSTGGGGGGGGLC